MRGGRSWGRTLAFLGLAALLAGLSTLLILEGAVRVLHLTPDKSMIPHRVMPGDEAQAPRPNARTRTLLGEVEATNSLGLRDPERPLARGDGAPPRVALVGDSVVWGFGLPPDATIARRLEALAGTDAPVQVWTLAQPATAWPNHAARYARLGPRIAPDVVLAFVLVNDLLAGPTRFRVTPSGLLADPARRAPYPDAWRPVLDRSASFHVVLRGLAAFGRRGSPYAIEHAPHLFAALEETRLAAGPARFVVVLLPGRYEAEGQYAALGRLARAWAAERGLDLLDLAEVVGQPMREELILPRDSTHPNAEGADRIAEALLGALRE